VFSIPAYFNRSILQGLLNFKEMVLSLFIENSTKLILGVLLVYLSWYVEGAMMGIVAATFLSWIISKKYVDKHVTDSKTEIHNSRQIWRYSLPIIIQNIANTSLYSS